MIKILFLLIITLTPTFISAQSYSTHLTDWKSNPLPKDQSYKGHVDVWTVYLEDGQPKVTDVMKKVQLPKKIDISKSKDYTLSIKLFGQTDPSGVQTVNNGFLISLDQGEFGGQLYWFSKRGRKNYTVADGNYGQFITRGNEILVLEDTNVGNIKQLIKKDGKWAVENYLKLPYPPQTAILDMDDNILVVTSKNIVSVDKNKQMKTVVTLNLWEHHFVSTSMILHNNTIYVGMQFGVYKYSLDTGKSEWLTPN